jgi:hypothetical protein
MSALSRAAILVACAATGCGTTILRSGEIIDRYARAACIPAVKTPGIGFNEVWDETVTLRSGTRVRVVGRTDVIGRINVEYDGGRTKATLRGGEKSNPSDVRYDAASERLYVKIFGLADLFGKEKFGTWLYEFDVAGRRELESPRVDPAVLPEPCPVRAQQPEAGARRFRNERSESRESLDATPLRTAQRSRHGT